MTYSIKGASVSVLYAVVDKNDNVLFSRGGSSSTPKLLVYADEISARRGLSNSWSKQHIIDKDIKIKCIYNNTKKV
jgi:hypothetical protein